MATAAVSSVENKPARGGLEARYGAMGRRERDKDELFFLETLAMNGREKAAAEEDPGDEIRETLTNLDCGGDPQRLRG